MMQTFSCRDQEEPKLLQRWIGVVRAVARPRGVSTWKFLGAMWIPILLLMPTPKPLSSQEGSDAVSAFLTMDRSVRMWGFSGLKQSGPELGQERTGFALHAKQLLSDWVGFYLQGQVMDGLLSDSAPVLEADLGIEILPFRAGPLTLALSGFAGMHNLSPEEGQHTLLQYGAGGGLYLTLNSTFVVGITASPTTIDTLVGGRTTYALHVLLR